MNLKDRIETGDKCLYRCVGSLPNVYDGKECIVVKTIKNQMRVSFRPPVFRTERENNLFFTVDEGELELIGKPLINVRENDPFGEEDEYNEWEEVKIKPKSRIKKFADFFRNRGIWGIYGEHTIHMNRALNDMKLAYGQNFNDL
jgi:hypothetical protein